MATYRRNPLNTDAQRGFAFPGQQLRRSLITKNIGIPYFRHAGDSTTLAPVMMVYAIGRCAEKGLIISSSAAPLAALEIISPNLPDESFTDRDSARVQFSMSVIRFLIDNGFDNNIFTATIEREFNNVDVEESVRERLRLIPFPIRGSVTDLVTNLAEHIPGNNITPSEALALLLNWCCQPARLTPRGRYIGTSLYTLMYTTMAKRGQVTSQKLMRIKAQVESEVSGTIDLTGEQITSLLTGLTGIVNETNAQDIMEGMRLNIAQFSLRLRLTIDQTVNSGMTCYWSIRTAVTRFADFPWDQASRYIPDDFIKFAAAVRVVGDNAYYGFSTDLGIAKSTNFKSLAWLAINLLVKYKGAEFFSLTNYKGAPSADRQNELQALINNYTPEIPEEGLENLEDLLAQIILGAD